MEPVRLNKYLSEIGVCSRRQADALVAEGRVTVNGKMAENGLRITDQDTIEIDHKIVTHKKSEIKPVVLAVNKPVGYVVSTEGQGAKTIHELIDFPCRVYAVGRLDKDSEGLILMTNQGELANQICKSRYYHEKEYVVTINKPVTEDFIKRMASGVPILDTVTRTCKVWKTGEKTFHIVLTQGLNRQIRRMCEALQTRVIKLKRIRIMNIQLGNLALGTYRKLSDEEMVSLKDSLRVED